ncbi:copine-8-like isoform X1 [Mercenaria mercenaria]|uniref:copine-8-like isoform X1 n=1 Tax=Mercenaria mercenaria TaxID=6596 RepID=UPI00234E8727|nr:copine-8-like isoform X1 [Mercenaria mercenaria]
MAVPPSQFQAGTSAVPATQVEISVSCRGLRDLDTFSKSDPLCVLFTRDGKTGSYYEFGRTEMISDNLNPDFVKKFVINYYFEESQKLKFEIYDVDSKSSRLSDHDFLGRMECTLGEVVATGGNFERPLQGPTKNNGKIIVRSEELGSNKEVIHMQMKANNLDKKDFFGKSDPYLEFMRVNEDNSFTVVHRTEVIKNTLNPTWAPFRVPARSLCNGDYDRSILVKCWDWNSSGSPDIIGQFTTNLRELTRGPGQNNVYEVINEQKKAKKKGKYKNSGAVSLLSCKVEMEYSFLDYITSGTEMAFTVAIDFTASNGNPSSPSSLHYINPYGTPNQYCMAIQAVGDIIQDYDSDKLFPALGFGARFPDNSVQHEFSLNFNPQNPYCAGVQGILGAYQNAIRSVQLYGPTNFAPCINHVARFAASKTDGSCYFVLLIITDGVITDMPQTMQAIVNASTLPMSIIIVGVGDADFEAMNVLDGDEVRLSYQGRYAQRDIVQFVPFRDFSHRVGTQSPQIAQTALAKEVLAEVPDQLVSYMKSRGIMPKQTRPATAPPPYS